MSENILRVATATVWEWKKNFEICIVIYSATGWFTTIYRQTIIVLLSSFRFVFFFWFLTRHSYMWRRIRHQLWWHIITMVNLTDQNVFFYFTQANDIFGMQVKDLHSRFEIFHLKWLNMTEFVPKDLNENLSDTYLQNNVTLRKVLHPIYVGMQHIAVGLEQVAWDYKREGLPNAVYLRNSTIQLKGVSLMWFRTCYHLKLKKYSKCVPIYFFNLDTHAVKLNIGYVW